MTPGLVKVYRQTPEIDKRAALPCGNSLFVHQIDPVITQVGGFYLWYYGLSYTLGFLAVFAWLSMIRHPCTMQWAERLQGSASILWLR